MNQTNNDMIDPRVQNLIDVRIAFESFCKRYDAGAPFRIVDNGHTLEIVRAFVQDDEGPAKWTTRQKVDYVISKGITKAADIARFVGVNQSTVGYHLEEIKIEKIIAEKRADG